MKIRRALLFAAIHFGALAATFAWSFSSTMDRFETGVPATALETAIDLVLDVLSMPLGWLLLNAPINRDWVDLVDMLAWPIIVANSLLWGFAAEYLVSRIGRRPAVKETR